jgi:DNA end-binding protein Ku
VPRAIWTGAISFGLVNIPIKLVTAVDRKNVRFREIRKTDNAASVTRRSAQPTARRSTTTRSSRATRSHRTGTWCIDPDELKDLAPKASRTIDIMDFVDLADIDPIYFDSSYYLVPQRHGRKAVRAAARGDDPHRQGRHRTLRAADQAVPRADPTARRGHRRVHARLLRRGRPGGPSRPSGEDGELDDREIKMAEQLIESMSADWEPDKYEDTYRQQVLELIEAKPRVRRSSACRTRRSEAGDVVDLIAALEASLAAKGKQDAEQPPSRPDLVGHPHHGDRRGP